MTPTFAWIASYGSALTNKPDVTVAKFGDGYEARIPIGMPINPRKWQLSFNSRANATADAIEAFLSDRNAVQSFHWAPPHGKAGKWVCREWSAQPTGPHTRSIACSFDEVFEPDVTP